MLSTVSERKPADSAPWLSIGIRTRGDRVRRLEETLACLSGQSVQNFEVLLMVHNPAKGALAKVQRAVTAFPKNFSNRIQIHVVKGGNRSTPLNQAISLASGEYYASLDDDDLVFGNWVEMFKRAATNNPGTVVRVQCLSQRWEILEDHDFATCAVGAASAEYPKKFKIAAHLSNNYTPNMSVAFPLSVIRASGIQYDEELDTAEDWDFMMRAIAAAQLVNVPYPGAIYRQWSNAKTSIQEHDREVWIRNVEKIQDKLRPLSFMIPAHEIIGWQAPERPSPMPSPSMVLKVAKLAFSLEVWKLALHYRIPQQLFSRRVSIRSLVNQVYRRISAPESES